ncbi:MAG: hypothetical protein QXU57_03975, partial [Fervidicoccaceae archaeon]
KHCHGFLEGVIALSEEEEVEEESTQEIVEETERAAESEAEEELEVTPEDMKVMVDIIEKIEEAYEGKLSSKELENIYKTKAEKKVKEKERKERKKKK